MLNDSSASQREETPHSVKSTQPNTVQRKQAINVALKRRAESIIEDKSIDAQSRVMVRYALEINDPWLPELVRCVEAGESLSETIKLLADSSDD
jgi:hypothetical protein